VAWLDDLLTQGVVARDDHICYSADDDFTNVPLHYVRFREGILLDYFSVSRVHSAFHLERVLSRGRMAAPDSFTGIAVPMRQDLERTDVESFLKYLDAPLTWLARHGLSGKTLRDDATLSRIAAEPLAHRVVHFSTHGDFPLEGGNPFRDSFLLLADESGLPDQVSVTSGGHRGRLTPASILEAGLDLEGSHVSMMACVSGLAKEGIAGDALGLDWAFIQAGAASLVSTHWNVSAAAAARFFTRFYARWIDDGQPRAAAFRATVLELLGSDRSPDALWQWSAFSLTGDFR
jgi:CHAT domain-containing protein